MEKPPAEYAQSTVHSTSATPTSEYGLNPSSARSSTFPEYMTRQPYPEGAPRYHPPTTNQSGGGPGMAPTSNPSSPLPTPDAHSSGRGGARSFKSDPDLVADPGIAATSPTYPPPAPYGHYPPQPDMSPAYPGQPGASNVYGRPPEWGPYPPHHPHSLPPAYGAHPSPVTPVSSASPSTPIGRGPGQVRSPLIPVPSPAPQVAVAPDRSPMATVRLMTSSQVYSFVPIPGAQQHKRPRRRYEEIERMYKCGWNGCEKAYGTLNHLNAHVTMQAHGAKRTPEGQWIYPHRHQKQEAKDVSGVTRGRSSRIDECGSPSLVLSCVTEDPTPGASLTALPFIFRRRVFLEAHYGPQTSAEMLTEIFRDAEFKEIRKEWKARKKDEDSTRKPDDDRQRVPVQGTPAESPTPVEPSQGSPGGNYPASGRPQLPPIGYTSPSGQVSSHYTAPANGIEQMQQYGNNSMYSNYPPSPYGQGGQVYQQRPKSLASFKVKDED
ncbi:MAG: hypothetical protein M1816_007022 [Peltula sp. TS41687]|nr:MAG: hypothetical protein M1816_007022 [Peltula sp. TS41687]